MPNTANIHTQLQNQSRLALGRTTTATAFSSKEAGVQPCGGAHSRAPGGTPASDTGSTPLRATKESETPTSCLRFHTAPVLDLKGKEFSVKREKSLSEMI